MGAGSIILLLWGIVIWIGVLVVSIAGFRSGDSFFGFLGLIVFVTILLIIIFAIAPKRKQEKGIDRPDTKANDTKEESNPQPIEEMLDIERDDPLQETVLSPIETIDTMNGREFEEYMFNIFSDKGYEVSLTPQSGDFGVDLILSTKFGKIGIQLKRASEKVSLNAVQEIKSGLSYYNLGLGLVITNKYYQPSAISLAEKNNITLWDRKDLELFLKEDAKIDF